MRLFRFLRKRNPVIFKDAWLGKFRGNIFESVPKFFPHSYSARILCEPALNVQWKIFERILWDGNHSQWFYTEQAVCERLHSICSEIYEARHKDEHYPNHFLGLTDGLPSVCIYEGYFVIWDANKIKIDEPS